MLASDYTRMGDSLRAVQNADWLHLDIMDGNFVPNISFGPDVVAALRPLTDMPFDVHLMLLHPKQYIEKFARAGADSITFHVECADDILETIAEIERFGLKPGLSVKPGTPAEALFPYLDRLYMALVMTVEPGFGGQKFMPEPLERCARCAQNARALCWRWTAASTARRPRCAVRPAWTSPWRERACFVRRIFRRRSARCGANKKKGRGLPCGCHSVQGPFARQKSWNVHILFINLGLLFT